MGKTGIARRWGSNGPCLVAAGAAPWTGMRTARGWSVEWKWSVVFLDALAAWVTVVPRRGKGKATRVWARVFATWRKTRPRAVTERVDVTLGLASVAMLVLLLPARWRVRARLGKRATGSLVTACWAWAAGRMTLVATVLWAMLFLLLGLEMGALIVMGRGPPEWLVLGLRTRAEASSLLLGSGRDRSRGVAWEGRKWALEVLQES